MRTTLGYWCAGIAVAALLLGAAIQLDMWWNRRKQRKLWERFHAGPASQRGHYKRWW